jgi:hypothetical protein
MQLIHIYRPRRREGSSNTRSRAADAAHLMLGRYDVGGALDEAVHRLAASFTDGDTLAADAWHEIIAALRIFQSIAGELAA